MKTAGLNLFILLSILILLFPLSVNAGEAIPEPGKSTVILQSFETKNDSAETKWNFLKQSSGPSQNQLSNGLMQKLAKALHEQEHIAVAGLGREASSSPVFRGLPTDDPATALVPGEGTRFVVSCSTTMSGDKVTIEVQLTDPKTKKLIAIKTIEGRPEDLSREISGTISQESPSEKALRAAITKAAAWIGTNTLASVIVKTSMTRVKEAPSLQSATLTTVQRGTILRKVSQDGEWIRVRLDSGETGWVYSEVVD